MKPVSGANFKFIWSPCGGQNTSWDINDAYPGSNYVSYIAEDIYGQWYSSTIFPPNGDTNNTSTVAQSQAIWNQLLTQPQGLNWLASLSQSTGKPTILPRIITLLIDTGSFSKLNPDPKILETAIDEGLRYISPGPVVLHGVKNQCLVERYKFRANRSVIILIYNIMHDSRYSKKANTFEISRQQNYSIHNFWFGTGIHFCMGSVLAKLEIETILKNLASLDGNLIITERKFRHNGIYPGYKSLKLSLAKT